MMTSQMSTSQIVDQSLDQRPRNTGAANRFSKNLFALVLLATSFASGIGCSSPSAKPDDKPKTESEARLEAISAPPAAPTALSISDLTKQAQEAELQTIAKNSLPNPPLGTVLVSEAPGTTTIIEAEPPHSTASASHPDLSQNSKAEKAHHVAVGINPEQSLGWLKNGNVRFLKQHNRSDGRSPTDRKRLVSGQKPHAVVVSCSDSRVPPEIVFDQALGEIFVVRTAGEALSSASIASIEYAVEHLGTRLIIVLGHTQCGAVQLAIDSIDGTSTGSLAVDQLIADIKPRLKTVLAQPRSSALQVESALNADGVARDLIKQSELLSRKAQSGEIMIKSALYNLETGKVNFY